jgi:glycosyltransferase involved in cell wall biosynthesis
MHTVSVVVPVYYNEANLPDTIPALLALQDKLTEVSLELIFVDDGSGDRSLEFLIEHQRLHPKVITVVKLTRNFGAMAAIQAGLTVARGDCVGVIAADLQDPPELLIEMIEYWKRGAKAVLSVRQGREDLFRDRLFAKMFYALIRRWAFRDYPTGGFDMCVVDRQVVDRINSIQEKNTNIMSLIFWLGYRPVLIPYVRRSRAKGKSQWTFAKKLKLFIDSLVAFTYVPIRLLTAVGFITALGALGYAVTMVVLRLVYGAPVPGFATIVTLIALTAGIQMMMLGVLGEYLWRVLDETRKRPTYVIESVIGGGVARE